ncbi:hypothetical protein MP638_000291, partial [Amoeboaphelidium occidentale]
MINLADEIPDSSTPMTIQEALNSPNKEQWQNAIDSEMNSLISNGTWTITDLPEGRKAIDNKWVFKIKYKSDGSIDKYKARLVVK